MLLLVRSTLNLLDIYNHSKSSYSIPASHHLINSTVQSTWSPILIGLLASNTACPSLSWNIGKPYVKCSLSEKLIHNLHGVCRCLQEIQNHPLPQNYTKIPQFILLHVHRFEPVLSLCCIWANLFKLKVTSYRLGQICFDNSLASSLLNARMFGEQEWLIQLCKAKNAVPDIHQKTLTTVRIYSVNQQLLT